MTLRDFDLAEQCYRKVMTEMVQQLPPEQRLAYLTLEQRLEGLSPEQRLAGLTPEQILGALPPETLEQLARKLNQ